MEYVKTLEVRWADLDPNNHVLHSKYYDFGAYIRICYFHDHGITMQQLAEHTIGPILFSEECLFKKEIRFADVVKIDIQLRKSKKDFSRWSMVHNVYIRENILAAQMHLDGAWIDTVKRKLKIPPENFFAAFENMPRTDDFMWS